MFLSFFLLLEHFMLTLCIIRLANRYLRLARELPDERYEPESGEQQDADQYPLPQLLRAHAASISTLHPNCAKHLVIKSMPFRVR